MLSVIAMIPVIQNRAEIGARIQAETGIDEPMIERLVDRFYQRVRDDAVIGPVFAARVADWPRHLAKMCRFWSSVALMTGTYHGQPMRLHAPLPIDAEHFDRWLALFETTVTEICPPKAAEHFLERARRIAESLEMGIAVGHGALLAQGERYRRGGPAEIAEPPR
jgi:hemoglobin